MTAVGLAPRVGAARPLMAFEPAASHVAASGPIDFVPTIGPPTQASLPRRAVFVACANSSLQLCAYRRSQSATEVIVARGGEIADRLLGADDPRMFSNGGQLFLLNNKMDRKSVAKLTASGRIHDERRLLLPGKNLVPISWEGGGVFFLDLQRRLLFPVLDLHASVADRTSITTGRPHRLSFLIQQASASCRLPKGCSLRGGSAGIVYDGSAYGVGHCSSCAELGRQVRHASFVWALPKPAVTPNERGVMRITPLCFSNASLVDASGLYVVPTTKAQSPRWLLATTETQGPWNTVGARHHANRLYEAAHEATIDLVSTNVWPLKGDCEALDQAHGRLFGSGGAASGASAKRSLDEARSRFRAEGHWQQQQRQSLGQEACTQCMRRLRLRRSPCMECAQCARACQCKCAEERMAVRREARQRRV